jgi:hypothetical protein
VSKKITISDLQKLASDNNQEFIKEIYLKDRRGMELRCTEGHIYQVSLSNFKNRNSRCSVCKGIECSKRQILSLEYVTSYIREKTLYEPIFSTYKGNSTPISLICKRHGIFQSTFDRVKSGHKCPKCSDNYQMSREEVKEWLSSHTKYSLVSPIYKKSIDKYIFKCPIHGCFKTKFYYVRQGHGCPKCGVVTTKDKTKLSNKQVNERITKCKYIWLNSDYVNQNTPLSLKCPIHGDFKHTLNGLKINSCPKCYTSKENLEILEYIKTLGFNPILNDRAAISPLELDIYVPEKQLAIEFNGLYWHCSLFKDKNYHFNKYKKCVENNIRLFGIFADEWVDKKDLIKAMIRHRLGIFADTKLRASKLELRKLNENKNYRDFFNKFHIDGHTNSKFAVGLFYNNELICCASFRNNGHLKFLEIARFATDYNYYIHGGLGRILKSLGDKTILSYSNNRIGNGEIYKSLGFKEITDKKVKPSYWYTDLKNKKFRTSFQRIRNPEILSSYPTEEKQALAGLLSKPFNHNKKIYKIYDYSHKKWLNSNL